MKNFWTDRAKVKKSYCLEFQFDDDPPVQTNNYVLMDGDTLNLNFIAGSDGSITFTDTNGKKFVLRLARRI